jgi:hypothetical protein
MATARSRRFRARSGVVGWLLPLLAGIVSFLVYLCTLAPDLTWAYHGADGGELITAAVTLGVPHPPGYPTYVLIGHLVGQIPVGTVAYRFNLFSAVAMATAVAILAAAASNLLPPGRANRRTSAAVAATAFAFLALPWQQALIAEVYGLNMVFTSLVLLSLLARWPVPVTGLLLGVALTTHPTSLLLTPAVLFTVEHREWPRLTAATVLGLSPLLALPFLARSGSPVVWGEPEQFESWWWLVTAGLYRPNLFGIPAAEAAVRLRDWLWSGQLVIPSILLLLAFWRRTWPSPRQGILLASTAALYLGLSFTYGPPDSAVLFLPGLACLMLLVTPFLARIGRPSLLLPTALLLINFSRLDLSAEREARSLGQQLLHETPRAAILLTEGDATTFTLWYLHEVEGQRPDITIIDRNLFGFDWYRKRLAERNQWLPWLPTYDLEVLARLGKPLCTARLDPGLMTIDCQSGETIVRQTK